MKDSSEELLQLLSAQKISSHETKEIYTSQAACDDTGSDNGNASKTEFKTSVSPLFSHYRYGCSFLHHDNSINLPTLPTYLPPIGVFWDIENCHVPKGRSAMAVTQVIRDKFFSGYREAEFIVVCDVQKENNHVMQELNDAQVNLIHVAATCKNAADEKLKQSIRRFADIHGSPAAIILISGDIDFAADLSDLRYRKKIHVILLHNKSTSEALILCANEHYDFMDLMEPLPSRPLLKVNEYYDLIITNLPEDKDVVVIKRRLQKMSDNCGGRVVRIKFKTAIVRFASKTSAKRAQKRMDGEYVFDSKISVRFYKETGNSNNKSQGNSITRNRALSESEIIANSFKQMYSASASIAGARTLQVPHYQSSSPVVGPYTTWTGVPCAPVTVSSGMIQPPPIFVARPYSASSDVTFNRSYNELTRVQSPLIWQVAGSQHFSNLWEDQYKPEKTKLSSKRIHAPQARDSSASNSTISRTPECLRPIKGGHNSFIHASEWAVHSQTNTFKRRSPSPMYETQKHERNNQWNGQNQHSVFIRNTRTPSPYEGTMVRVINQQNNHFSPYQQNDSENEEVEKFFHPINRNGNGSTNGSYTPIELQVSNLDQNIDPKEMKHILSTIFMEHVTVLHISIFMQSDGNYAASVKVASLPDAQYAISQLHRRKIGYKRILISYAHTGGTNPQLIRAQIVMLLQEVPGHKLPLFKFREMYESRFMISISISELYKMKDVCIVTEDISGRMVSLNPDHRNTPSPCFSTPTQEGYVELPYCTRHTSKPWTDKGWAEQEMASLPNVNISLKLLAPRIEQLLTMHNGSLPLPSLPNCYAAEFQEHLKVIENGVPLEHLVSCLSFVQLKQGIGSVKYLSWAVDKDHDDSHEENKCVSPPLANQLALFSRELVDLLKTAPHCQLPFNRFIPAYHHHFGRQCRVADYGFTKLIDLLEALTHTVQVMGEGNKRVVTLSHRAQVRRFTSDLLRVLKSKASKQVTLSEFPNVYSRVIAKPWDIVDYGVCEIEDILSEVSENTVVMTAINGGDKMIAIPKREQTPEEIERTKQFAFEVVELLRHVPQCKMLFNKFVPSYHHHFGHQCRVSDYGFTKLIELFEAIPDVVKIEDGSNGERQISLTEKEGLRVLSEQISKLVTHSKSGLSVSHIVQNFLRQFGYALRPELFGCNSVLQLMQKLDDSVKIIDLATGPVVVAIDKSHLQQLALQCRRVLMDQPQYKMPVQEFQKQYSQYYSKTCNIEELKKDLSHVVQFKTINEENFIELTSLYCFACNLYRVMMSCEGQLNLSRFEAAYLAVNGSACRAAQYGFPTLTALLQALPCTVILKDTRKDKRKKKVIYLNKKLAAVGIALPSTYASGSSYHDTDSSNESFESDSSSRINASSNASTLEEYGKWITHAINGHGSWKQNEDNHFWTQDCEKHWKVLTHLEERANNWPLFENNNEGLKNFIHTPTIMQNDFPPPPPKPDSPPEVDIRMNNQWKSSVWIAPTKILYSQDERVTNVDVPPLTLPAWNQMSEDDILNLLSPTKNLLPAAANPLNPRTSPYYSTKHNLVVAPHPSELPLPSLSLTPKKNASSESISVTRDSIEKQDVNSDNIGEVCNTENFEKENNIGNRKKNELLNTPTKPLFTGKRRLAAQFNQPLQS
ncbi:meiosis regulator and mRNA stability factor 1 isoform X1 [Polistes fuscatus]|uniref:meiosis regulator and mRNA stability factor 1 isoform X1 n=2 Tax=Polistes fuscatus TaxID=30207 RepID=UPI001CA7FA67|nr:meiosis regulator and mRNA stability factor 1 isoform X1 [Polistes fuscatus]